LVRPRTPRLPLVPYTTLFRSPSRSRERITSPCSVNLQALDSRFLSTCSRRWPSVITLVGKSLAQRTSNCNPFCSASGANIPRKRSEEHTSELQSREKLVCRLL